MSITFKKIVCSNLSTDFHKATKVVTVDFDPTTQLEGDQVLIKTSYAGINATDININAGIFEVVSEGCSLSPPFDIGLESIGTVAAIGSNVKDFKVGDFVACQNCGSFAEYQILKEKELIPIPKLLPSLITALISGPTAYGALAHVGKVKSGETVLVTAAAGGTGSFAVQVAKQAGAHVIGTCSTKEKEKLLKGLGCDRVINYKQENLAEVLGKEYPKGLDVVYECVGGQTFEDCVDNLAKFGRLIVIGMISGYQDESSFKGGKDLAKIPLAARLLLKSASIQGFLLPHYEEQHRKDIRTMIDWIMDGKIKAVVDEESVKRFVGVESVADAVDYLYAKKNLGKVIVKIDPQLDIPQSV